MKTIDVLKQLELDTIPRYLFMRDILKVDRDTPDMQILKAKVLKSDHVRKITDEQLEDGSWGRFHTLSTITKDPVTTEQALKRLFYLGLDRDDETIKKAISYMEGHLEDKYDFRDYNEKKHDWRLFSHMMAATWILIFDKDNELALDVAKKRAKVLEHTFKDGHYDSDAYVEAYNDILNPEKGKFVWPIENFYQVSMPKGLLSKDTERAFVEYITSSDNGIYYIYNKPLKILPTEFLSKETLRFINAYSLIGDYDTTNNNIQRFIDWMYSNIGDDNMWDIGTKSKDKYVLPLSNSWRKAINRKIDSTITILKVLDKFNTL